MAGLWDGAVALARACLEETLEDRIGRRIGHQKRELNTWLSEAERLRLLTRDQLTRARSIQASGNFVLHDRSATEEEARDAIQALRILLSELYRRAA